MSTITTRVPGALLSNSYLWGCGLSDEEVLARLKERDGEIAGWEVLSVHQAGGYFVAQVKTDCGDPSKGLIDEQH